MRSLNGEGILNSEVWLMSECSVEKRRCKRVPVSMALEISTLFKQDNVKVGNVDAPIEIINISKTGIGFVTKSVLPIGYYFNSRIQLGDEDSKFYCVVRIVRREVKTETEFIYGCEFIGLAPVFEHIFDEYEATVEA